MKRNPEPPPPPQRAARASLCLSRALRDVKVFMERSRKFSLLLKMKGKHKKAKSVIGGVKPGLPSETPQKVNGTGGKIRATLDQPLNCLSRRSPYCAARGFIVRCCAAVMYSVFAIVRHNRASGCRYASAPPPPLFFIITSAQKTRSPRDGVYYVCVKRA